MAVLTDAATTSSVASRTFISGEDVISVSLEVHDGGKLQSSANYEISPRPSSGAPEWIEVQNTMDLHYLSKGGLSSVVELQGQAIISTKRRDSWRQNCFVQWRPFLPRNWECKCSV